MFFLSSSKIVNFFVSSSAYFLRTRCIYSFFSLATLNDLKVDKNRTMWNMCFHVRGRLKVFNFLRDIKTFFSSLNNVSCSPTWVEFTELTNQYLEAKRCIVHVKKLTTGEKSYSINWSETLSTWMETNHLSQRFNLIKVVSHVSFVKWT